MCLLFDQQPQADGTAIFCPVVGKKGRVVAMGTGCRTVAISGAFGAEWLGVWPYTIMPTALG